MIVAPSSVAELEAAPEFAALSIEYAVESQIEGMPPANPQWESYRALESMGLLHVFSALSEERLIGFISVIVSVLPRYGEPVAVTESFFVARTHRKTGAGLKLLKQAEEKALELAGGRLLVSSPLAGDLSQVLPRCGYEPASLYFFKQVTSDV